MKQPTKKQNKMRMLAIFMICSTLLGLAVLPVSAVESGDCGDGLGWVLNAGTLTITGSGSMTNYKDGRMPPWYEFREDIVRVNISEQVSSIGDFAFYGCNNLVSVYIPNAVKSIGNYAFASCERLASVQMSGSVSSVGNGAFYNCYDLESIRLPYGLSSIGDQAFYRCESLHCISVPADVRDFGNSVFAYCKGLVRAEIYARITELPAWTFYGCTQLSEVYLAETINSIDNYGFKKCETLSTVFFSGNEKQAELLETQIVADVAEFAVRGYFSSEDISDATSTGKFVENDNKTATQTNTTVVQNDQLVMGYVVERVYPLDSTQKGSYTADVFVTVEQDKNWTEASEAVSKTLTEINNTYTNLASVNDTTVTVYIESDVKMSDSFLDGLSGRDVELVVVSTSGSSWKIDCKDLVASDPESNSGSGVGRSYLYSLQEASNSVCERLGTNNCFRLIFDESAEQNAEVLVQLPTKTAVRTNAFLYQVERDGSHTRLQAVAVDNNGYAHLYIASVDKNVDYIIALDVPGESTSDIIIPDELIDSDLSSALERLEKIEYVHMGRVSSWGIGVGRLTWIIIGVLLGTTFVVGAVMLMWNKRKRAEQTGR